MKLYACSLVVLLLVPTGAIGGHFGAPPGDDAILIYEPSNGYVGLDATHTDSGRIISFVMATDQNNMRPENAAFPFINTGTNTDAEVFQIGQSDALNIGAGPLIDLGNIFPPGMNQEGLEAYLTLAEYASDLGAGGTLDLCLCIPEPSGLVLFVLGTVALAARRRGRRTGR